MAIYLDTVINKHYKDYHLQMLTYSQLTVYKWFKCSYFNVFISHFTQLYQYFSIYYQKNILESTIIFY